MTGHMQPPPVDAGAESRRRWLEHIRDCRSCRDRWIAEDPSRMFVLLGEVEPDRAILDEVSGGVMAAIRSEPAATRWAPAAMLARSAALLAAGILLAALLLPFAGGPAPGRSQEEMLSRAEVEVLSSTGSTQVVDLTVGDTQVVMIFDEGLEL
jgi:hypothetical protein